MRIPYLALIIGVAVSVGGFLRYGDAPVYGAYRAVSSADLQAAVAAAYKGKKGPHTVYRLHVAGRDEVWVYYSPPGAMDAESYYIVKRINGHWKCDEMMHDWRIEHHI